MFGQNPIAKKRHEADGFLVHSVFYTIQGEGPWAGLPTIFLRLAGCNLQCNFCFVGSTRIRMGDGSVKRIAEVQIGDMVLAYDTESGKFAPKRVINTMQSKTKELVTVRTGASTNETDLLTATYDHPILVRDKGWVKAGELQPGDIIVHLSENNKAVMAAALQAAAEFVHNGHVVSRVDVIPMGSKAWIRYAGSAKSEAHVYNLEVEDWHTYVANGKVVHNCDTEFTEGAQPFSLQSLGLRLINMAKIHNCNKIVITGGEPMLQPLSNLIKNLPSLTFQIETAGTVWPAQFEEAVNTDRVLIVCSPKTPKVHWRIKVHCSHYKYIIDSPGRVQLTVQLLLCRLNPYSYG